MDRKPTAGLCVITLLAGRPGLASPLEPTDRGPLRSQRDVHGLPAPCSLVQQPRRPRGARLGDVSDVSSHVPGTLALSGEASYSSCFSAPASSCRAKSFKLGPGCFSCAARLSPEWVSPHPAPTRCTLNAAAELSSRTRTMPWLQSRAPTWHVAPTARQRRLILALRCPGLLEDVPAVGRPRPLAPPLAAACTPSSSWRRIEGLNRSQALAQPDDAVRWDMIRTP